MEMKKNMSFDEGENFFVLNFVTVNASITWFKSLNIRFLLILIIQSFNNFSIDVM